MAEKKKVTLNKTAAGAQQKGSYESSKKASKKVYDDARFLSASEFKNKYNMPKMEAINLMAAAVQAAISQDKKKRTGSPNVLADKYEKEDTRQRTLLKSKRKMNKGGMVKKGKK
jgi:hypothetical protein